MDKPIPNKLLGQHWLTDKKTLQEIVAFSGVKKGDNVLEIGPGPGSLTEVLITTGVNTVAVEFDLILASVLPDRFHSPLLKVVHGDILKFDLSQMPENYSVVANVPYYITSKIVRILLESTNPPKSATLLVQKEVAERIAAPPGEMSMLSVSAQFYADITLGPVVPASMFTPPPKVDSQVARLDYTGSDVSGIDPKVFFRVVKAGFGERRKKLRSSLAGGLQLTKEQVDGLLQKAGINPDVRAQELTLDDWRKIVAATQA